MLSLISSLSLKICWCTIEISSGLPRKSLVVFGNLRKISENVRATFGLILENLRKSYESGRKSSEIVNYAVISMSI